MNKNGMSRSGLFLMELIIVILFFTIACSIALQLFVKATELGDNAAGLNGSIFAAQSAAEVDKNTPLPALDVNGRTEYYNGNWEKTDQSGQVYTLHANVVLENRWAGTMAIFTYTIESNEVVLYELTAKKYYSHQQSAVNQERGGSNE